MTYTIGTQRRVPFVCFDVYEFCLVFTLVPSLWSNRPRSVKVALLSRSLEPSGVGKWCRRVMVDCTGRVIEAHHLRRVSES